MFERVKRMARKFLLKDLEFNKIVDAIMDELIRAINNGEDPKRIAEMLEKKYSKETGLAIKVVADENGATIKINDLEFDYDFIDEEMVEEPKKHDLELPYIR